MQALFISKPTKTIKYGECRMRRYRWNLHNLMYTKRQKDIYEDRRHETTGVAKARLAGQKWLANLFNEHAITLQTIPFVFFLNKLGLSRLHIFLKLDENVDIFYLECDIFL